MRQERVLLRLVEAVDLVDEEDRALAAAARARVSASAIDLPQLLDAGEHGGERRRSARRVASASSRASVVLPVPGGPQRIIECRSPRSIARAEQRARAEEVSLADELVEDVRPHPLGERRRLAPTLARPLLEQVHAVRSLTTRPVVGRHGSRAAVEDARAVRRRALTQDATDAGGDKGSAGRAAARDGALPGGGAKPLRERAQIAQDGARRHAPAGQLDGSAP